MVRWSFSSTVFETSPRSSRVSKIFQVVFLLLWRITIDEWKQAIRGLAPFSLVEYRALDVLETEEVLTPSELSSLLRIPRSNATLVLQKLEGANLIHIEEDVDDGRQRIVTLFFDRFRDEPQIF